MARRSTRIAAAAKTTEKHETADATTLKSTLPLRTPCQLMKFLTSEPITAAMNV